MRKESERQYVHQSCLLLSAPRLCMHEARTMMLLLDQRAQSRSGRTDGTRIAL